MVVERVGTTVMLVVREVGSVRTESGDVDSNEGGSAFVSAYHDPNKVLIP